MTREFRSSMSRSLAVALAAVLALAATSRAESITASYSDNFGSYTNDATPDDFSVGFYNSSGTTQSWSVQDGAYRYTGQIGAYAGASGAVVEVGNLGPVGKDFTISSTLKLDSVAFSSSGGNRPAWVGLGALGDSLAAFSENNYAAAGFDFYWGAFKIAASGFEAPAGQIDLFGPGQKISSGSTKTIPVNTTDTYEMILNGTYVGSALQLDYTVTNLNTLASVSVSLTDNNPLTGQFFGYRTYAFPRYSANIVANFDNFAITVPTVPEPGTIGLLATGLLAALAYAWRRRK